MLKRWLASPLFAVILLLSLPSQGDAQWILRTQLGTVGMQYGAERPGGLAIELKSPRVDFSILSLGIGHNICRGFGAGMRGTLVDRVYSPVSHDGFSRAFILGPFLSWGAIRMRHPAAPVVTLSGVAGFGSDGMGSYGIGGSFCLLAEWSILRVLTLGVSAEMRDVGPAATVSVGLGRWWTFGR